MCFEHYDKIHKIVIRKGTFRERKSPLKIQQTSRGSKQTEDRHLSINFFSMITKFFKKKKKKHIKLEKIHVCFITCDI